MGRLEEKMTEMKIKKKREREKKYLTLRKGWKERKREREWGKRKERHGNMT